MKTPYKGKFKVSQIYKGSNHKGLDLVGLDDKTIYSTINGTVEVAWMDTHPTGGMGLYIRIKQSGTNYRYYFAHLSKAYVEQGQTVKVGDKIGVEGNTGHSFGSHLHYEVRREPNNTTFMDIAKISGIPNKLGVYGIAEVTGLQGMIIKEVVVTIGTKVVKSYQVNGVTYTPLRETIEAIKSQLDVTWDKANGAGVKL